MSDIDTIKERIRKLMAVANDGVATDGEIDNAMRLAAKLIDAHHVSPDEVEEIAGDEPEADIEFGRAFATTQTARVSTWELRLADAIAKLFGSLKVYTSNRKAPVRVNGVVKLDRFNQPVYGKQICFYGPLLESQEAASLMEEWSRSIASMGVIRWGGCFRGDGAAYCYGFAVALFNKACEINSARGAIEAKPIPQLSNNTTAITLADRYSMLRDEGARWLKEECKVDLVSGGSRSGYSLGDGAAFAEGKTHGSAAQFGRAAKRKMLGNG